MQALPGIDERFLRQVQAISLVLTLILGGLLALKVDPRWGAGFTLAGLWSVANLVALDRLVHLAVRPSGRKPMAILLALLVKLPLLYGIGFLIAMRGRFAPTALMAGFSLPFLVMLLRALGRLLATRARSTSTRSRASTTAVLTIAAALTTIAAIAVLRAPVARAQHDAATTQPAAQPVTQAEAQGKSAETATADAHAPEAGHDSTAQAGAAHEGAEHESTEHESTEHEGAGHDGAHEESGHIELPNWVSLLREHAGLGPRVTRYLGMFEASIFAICAGLLLTILSLFIFRRLQTMPGRPQAFAELVVETVDSMVQVVMGPRGRHYTPFVGTLFLYLLFMNYSGLIPLAKAPTSTWVNNVSLSLCVFLYVQYTGLRKNGPWGYFKHLCGSPTDVVGWALSPLMLFLEIFGELIKPVSLSLRLFGNIFGEDMLLAIFALLGVGALSVLKLPLGLPLHFPFMLLSLLLGFIQAMVFSLLSTVYISLMLPHEHHDDHEHDAHGASGAPAQNDSIHGHGGTRGAELGAAQPTATS